MNWLFKKTQKNWSILTTLFLFIGITYQLNAANIAYIDAKRLLEEAPQGKDEVQILEKKFGEENKKLQDKLELIRIKQSNLDKNSVLMSNEEIEVESRKINELKRELEKEQNEYNNDFSNSRNEGLVRLESLILEVIFKIAKEKNIDVVLQQVVYANESIDLTEKVLDELQSRYRE